MSERVPVVFAFDRRVVRPAAVALQSLMDAALPTTSYDIHVLHPGFGDAQAAGFEAIVDRTRHRMYLHRVDARQFEGLPAGRGSWTEIVYYRFAIPEVLAHEERAIYSDMDVFFTGDLSSLMKLDMQGCPIGAVIGEVNGPDMQCHTYFPENTKAHVFMSGFLLMDLERMRQEQLPKRLIDTARRFSGRLRMFDLDALNLGCDRILPLSFRYCVLESIYAADDIAEAGEFPWLSRAHSRDALEQAKASPIIIHYAGPLGKPWRRPNPPAYYKAYLDRVPRSLRVHTWRDFRKYWLAKLLSPLRGERR